jgi:hypothetical protein
MNVPVKAQKVRGLTVTQRRSYMLMAQARAYDRAAGRALAKALQRKAETEARLKKLGMEVEPLEAIAKDR